MFFNDGDKNNMFNKNNNMNNNSGTNLNTNQNTNNNMWNVQNNNLGNNTFFGNNNMTNQNDLNKNNSIFGNSPNNMMKTSGFFNNNTMGNNPNDINKTSNLFGNSTGLNSSTDIMKNNSFFGSNINTQNDVNKNNMTNNNNNNNSNSFFGSAFGKTNELNKGSNPFFGNTTTTNNDLTKNTGLFGTSTNSSALGGINNNAPSNAFNPNLFSAAKKEVFPGFSTGIIGNNTSNNSNIFKKNTLGSSIALGSQLNEGRATESGLFSKEQLEAAKQIFANSSSSLSSFNNKMSTGTTPNTPINTNTTTTTTNNNNSSNNKITFSGGFSSSSSTFAKNNVNPFQTMALQATTQTDKSSSFLKSNNNVFLSSSDPNKLNTTPSPFGLSSIGNLNTTNKLSTFPDFSQGNKTFLQNDSLFSQKNNNSLFGNTANNTQTSTGVAKPLVTNFNSSFSAFGKTSTTDIFKTNTASSTATPTPFGSAFGTQKNNDSLFGNNAFKLSTEAKSNENPFLFNNNNNNNNTTSTSTFNNAFSIFGNKTENKNNFLTTTTTTNNNNNVATNLLETKPTTTEKIPTVPTLNVVDKAATTNESVSPSKLEQTVNVVQAEKEKTTQMENDKEKEKEKEKEMEKEKEKEKGKEIEKEKEKLDDNKTTPTVDEKESTIKAKDENVSKDEKLIDNKTQNEKTEKPKDNIFGSTSLFGSSLFKASPSKDNVTPNTKDKNETTTTTTTTTTTSNNNNNSSIFSFSAANNKSSIFSKDNNNSSTFSFNLKPPSNDKNVSTPAFSFQSNNKTDINKSTTKENDDDKKKILNDEKTKEANNLTKAPIFNFDFSKGLLNNNEKEKTLEDGKDNNKLNVEVKESENKENKTEDDKNIVNKSDEDKNNDDKKKFWRFPFGKKKETKDANEEGIDNKNDNVFSSDTNLFKNNLIGNNTANEQKSLFQSVDNQLQENKNKSEESKTKTVSFSPTSVFNKPFDLNFEKNKEENKSNIFNISSNNKTTSSLFGKESNEKKTNNLKLNSNDDDVNNVSDMINFISLENRKKNVFIGNSQEYEENNKNKSNLFLQGNFFNSKNISPTYNQQLNKDQDKMTKNQQHHISDHTKQNDESVIYNFNLKETKGTLRNNENTKDMNFNDIQFNKDLNEEKYEHMEEELLANERKIVENNIKENEILFKKELDQEMILDIIDNLSSFVKNKINFMNYCSNEIIDIYNKVAHYEKMYNLISDDQIKIEKKQEALEKKLRLIQSEQTDILTLLNEMDNETSVSFLKIFNDKNTDKEDIIHNKNLHLDIEHFEKLSDRMSNLEEIIDSLQNAHKDDILSEFANKSYINELNCDNIQKQLNSLSNDLKHFKG